MRPAPKKTSKRRATHYAVLGVPPGFTAEELRAAYLVLAKKLHPDTNGAKTANRYAEINLSWGVLKNVEARRKYDAELKVLGGQCATCEGAGLVQRSQGFKAVVRRICKDCDGTGQAEV